MDVASSGTLRRRFQSCYHFEFENNDKSLYSKNDCDRRGSKVIKINGYDVRCRNQ